MTTGGKPTILRAEADQTVAASDDDEAATVWSASARSIVGLPPVVILLSSSRPAGIYHASRNIVATLLVGMTTEG
jgi:hypothetical protein